MSRPLTKQQQTVYDFIRNKIVLRGYGPTVREIGEHMDIKSPNGVMCHLRALERKGMIVRRANKSRAIELTEPIVRQSPAALEVRGRVSAAGCSWLATSVESLDLSPWCGPESFAVEVGDDSLLEAHIRSGDWLVVRRQTLARSGQLCLVRLGLQEVCLRYVFREAGRLRLQPVVRSTSPAIGEQAEVIGVVSAVIRDLAPAQFASGV